ncbi:MAG: class I SAM-dependent methyltransferase [Candidatus Pristimantibacillus sp.]
MIAAIKDIMVFVYKFTRSPKYVGSVSPSSIFLAKKMVGSIPWGQVSTVAELGAGTGAITKYLDKVIKPNTKVILFEKDDDLRNKLAQRYSDYSIYKDAGNLKKSIMLEGVEQLDCIISGLPFFNFRQSMREQLLEEIVSALRPGGLFITFQYSQQMKRQLSQYFNIEHIDWVSLNIPPAFVYVCRKV